MHLMQFRLNRMFVMFKVNVPFLNRTELNEVVSRTTLGKAAGLEKVMDGQRILALRAILDKVVVAPPVRDYCVRLVLATHPGGEHAVASAARFIRYGASPRGAQALILASKVRALASGRYNVSFDDIRTYARPALRHRLILNFEGEAEGVTPDQIIDQVVEAAVPPPTA